MARLIVVVASTLGWPIVEVAVFWLRFGRLPEGRLAASLVFLPMGLVAGLFAAWLMTVASTPRQVRSVVWGYVVAIPFAFVGSLLGGLGAANAWGPLLAGGIPLALGSAAGFFVGRRAASD